MMRRLLFALLVLASPASALAQAPPAPPAAPSAPGTSAAPGGRAGVAPAAPMTISTDVTGWTSIFDGVSLKGWDGPALWQVKDESIYVESRTDPPTGSVYLIWQGGQPKDFELKLKVKLEGDGANSGVQFRAMLLGEAEGRPMTKWESHGYQADMTNQGGAGTLINCCQGPRRGPPRRADASAGRGQVMRSSTTEDGTRALLATVEEPAILRANWKPNDWNELHIIARGRVMMHIVNGHLASVLIDDHPTLFRPSGYIAVQLEGQGANKAWFKDLWIKQLPE